jgi:hypothetical protein
VTSTTSWLDYLIEVTLPTRSSSTRTALRVFGKTRVPSACGCDPPCVLLSTWPFCLACRDEPPTSGTPSCTASCATSGLWLCDTELVACSVCRDPCLLEVSDSGHSGSSIFCLASYAGFFSCSTITGFVSYSGVWSSSTSTITGVVFSLASVTRAVLRVFLSALPNSPTLGGDIVTRSRLKICELDECLVEFSLYLSSTWLYVLSLAIDTMTCFSPLFLTL